MKTLVITIDGAVNGECPVTVYFDDGSANWRSDVKAKGAIGAGLTKPPYPTNAAGDPLPPDAIVAFLQTEDRSSPVFQIIGEHLWSLFDKGAVGTYLADIWSTHARTNTNDVKDGIRTILDVRAADLRKLPWELLFRKNVALFASPLNPVVRGPLVPAKAPEATGFLLRVLVIVGSEPDDPAVKAEEEIDYLEDATRAFRREIDLRVERPVTRAALTTAYGEFMPHVLHFTGHGGQVPRAIGGPVSSLVFHGGEGGRWDWQAPEIQGTLAVGAPRLAFLNACRSGTAAAREIVGTLADEFLAAGTLGVVAMQADIAGSAAAEFAGASYAALAHGQPLDIALAQARYTVRERGDMVQRRDWSLPSLTVAVDVSEVLPARLQLPKDRRDLLETTPEFVNIQAFVDRRTQRREVDPMAPQPPAEDVLMVTGPPDTGKTAMLLWFLEGCVWCGHRVKYVDLERGRPRFFDVLDWIERGEADRLSDLRQALPGDFGRVRELGSIVRSGQPAVGVTPDDPVDRLFSAFRAALVASAQGGALVIALDHLGSMAADDFRKYLRPHLLDHVVQRRMRPVRFVLCCTDDEYRDLGIRTLQPARAVNVRNFAAQEFETLYREYLLFKKVPRASIPPAPWTQDEDFSPNMLVEMYELMAKYRKLGN